MFWIAAKPKVGQLHRRKPLPVKKSILIHLKRFSINAPSYKRCSKIFSSSCPNYYSGEYLTSVWKKGKKIEYFFISLLIPTWFCWVCSLNWELAFKIHLFRHAMTLIDYLYQKIWGRDFQSVAFYPPFSTICFLRCLSLSLQTTCEFH